MDMVNIHFSKCKISKGLMKLRIKDEAGRKREGGEKETKRQTV